MPKYPDLRVPLVGIDSNAFSLLGKATDCMRKYGIERDEIDQFRQQAMSGDFNNLLNTCMEWFTITDQDDEDVMEGYV
jgi:hypothetical protein